MSDLERSFLVQIASQPHDWQPRLVFADWLEEQGDLRGELIQLSHQLTQLECEARPRKEARYQQLVRSGVTWPSPRLETPLGLELDLIPPGSFLMGTPGSQVPVTLTRGFWIGQYTVTQGQWLGLMDEAPWEASSQSHLEQGPDYPACALSQQDAEAFCGALTRAGSAEGWLPEGWMVQLPTEAQWEYACRAGTRSRYSFGDSHEDLDQYAWYSTDRDEYGNRCTIRMSPEPVGRKLPNPWNLHDMHGNVWEWCQDHFGNLPGGEDPVVRYEVEDVKYLDVVLRGGCYFWYGNTGEYCSSANRLSGYCSVDRRGPFGFRLVIAHSKRGLLRPDLESNCLRQIALQPHHRQSRLIIAG